MLSLKSVLSKLSNLPAIIFDEIDTGVSGDIADRMGDIMKMMGEEMQVVSITHLPQIASKGKAHYKVFKVDTDEATVSNIKRLTDEERVREIAQMVSGSDLTDAAIENAKALLNR
jgi:DNA repair protein RecN (Recombination protein N)